MRNIKKDTREHLILLETRVSQMMIRECGTVSEMVIITHMARILKTYGTSKNNL